MHTLLGEKRYKSCPFQKEWIMHITLKVHISP